MTPGKGYFKQILVLVCFEFDHNGREFTSSKRLQDASRTWSSTANSLVKWARCSGSNFFLATIKIVLMALCTDLLMSSCSQVPGPQALSPNCKRGVGGKTSGNLFFFIGPWGVASGQSSGVVGGHTKRKRQKRHQNDGLLEIWWLFFVSYVNSPRPQNV